MTVRRRPVLLLLVSLAAAALLYGWQVEPRRVGVTRVSLPGHGLSRVLAGKKAALLSDLHLGPGPNPPAERALRILEEERPDLVLLAGDYVDWKGDPASYDRALELFARLRAPLGVYGVLGEADRIRRRRSCVLCHEEGSGAFTGRHRVAFLRNGWRDLDLPGGRLRIAGLDVMDSPEAAAATLRSSLADGTPEIVLSHTSVPWRDVGRGKDVLMVSGDTHGGQLRLPAAFWRLLRWKPDPEHLEGLFRDGRKALVVTRGVGTSHLPVRLGEPPEVVIIDFPAGRP